MKRKQPTTSHDAYESMKGTPISEHHQKIIAALDELKEAIYERIAIHIGWDDKNRCSRRLAELERLNLVEKTGETKSTSSGRKANIYRLVPPPPKEILKPNYIAHQPSLFPNL